MYKTIVLQAPTQEPVTVDQVKNQLRIKKGQSKDDSHIEMLISSARDKIEKYCNRFFTTQTISIVYDQPIPDRYICLPYPDLQSVLEISYKDRDGLETVISSSEYVFDSFTQRITFSNSTSYESVSYKVNVITGAPVEYSSVLIGLLMTINDLYDLRTESVVGFSIGKNPAVENQLYPYRINLGV